MTFFRKKKVILRILYDMEFDEALNVEIIQVFSHACNDSCFAGWITGGPWHRKT